MKRTRLSAAVAGLAILAALVIPATATSAAPGDAALTIFHGLGPAPNSVDIYVDGALLAPGVDFGDSLEAELPAGTYTVEVCGAVDPAPDPLPAMGCEVSADFPNGGVDLTVENNKSYTVVAQYAGTGATTGRPTVVAYENDLSCVTAGEGRIAFIHAATAPVVDVLFDGAVVFDNVVAESAPQSIEVAGNAAADIAMLIEIAADGTDLFDTTITQTPAGFNYTLIFVGNPQQDAFYALIDTNYALEDCVPPTIVTTAPAPTTTVPPAVTPVVANPRFTG